MLKHYKLIFAEIDMILNKENDYYFLEVNPKGQELWLEEESGYNLTKKTWLKNCYDRKIV